MKSLGVNLLLIKKRVIGTTWHRNWLNLEWLKRTANSEVIYEVISSHSIKLGHCANRRKTDLTVIGIQGHNYASNDPNFEKFHSQFWIARNAVITFLRITLSLPLGFRCTPCLEFRSTFPGRWLGGLISNREKTRLFQKTGAKFQTGGNVNY